MSGIYGIYATGYMLLEPRAQNRSSLSWHAHVVSLHGSYLAKDDIDGIGLEVTHRSQAAAYAFYELTAFWKDAHVQEAVKMNQ